MYILELNPKKSLEKYRSKSTLNVKEVEYMMYGYNDHWRKYVFKILKENPQVF